MVDRSPTIYDVAERAGVSKSLVSLVLRDSPQVSERRRDAVLSAIAELGYRPSQAATQLASARARSVELLVDDYRDLAFVGLVRGLRNGLTGHGYHLTVTEIPPAGGRLDLPGVAPAADARVLAGEPGPAVLAGWTGPTVVAGWRGDGPVDELPFGRVGADLVAADDEQGGRLVIEYLLGLGHHRIGHLSGEAGPAGHRQTGYRQAMAGAGLPALVVGEGGTTEEDGYQAAATLLDHHPDVTALVAANDLMAIGALAAAHERGRTIPTDLSIVGYDDSPVARYRVLDLTTVDDRSVAVGEAAAQALLRRITDPARPASRSLIAPELVVRGTTGPAPTTLFHVRRRPRRTR